MSKRNCAAVDVDPFGIDAKHPRGIERDIGKCLVDLDQIDLGGGQTARSRAISAAIAGVLARYGASQAASP